MIPPVSTTAVRELDGEAPLEQQKVDDWSNARGVGSDTWEDRSYWDQSQASVAIEDASRLATVEGSTQKIDTGSRRWSSGQVRLLQVRVSRMELLQYQSKLLFRLTFCSAFHLLSIEAIPS